MLAAVGLTGTLVFGPAFPGTAQPADATTEAHEAMNAMMDVTHGPGTADRMHQIPGVEEMMDQCAAMTVQWAG